MSRYYRRTRRNRVSSAGRVLVARSSASAQARAFVLNEFFSLDWATMQRVIELYGREYSAGARRYLESTFEKWRRGEVQPRRQTQDRILHCVPRFMSTAKQFQTLSYYIPEYMAKLAPTSLCKRLTADAVPTAFAEAASQCRATAPQLDWFISGVFTDQELAAFTNTVRFTVLDRLSRAYQAVLRDLATITTCLANLDASVSLRYRIEAVGGQVELGGGERPSLPTQAFALPPVPELVVRHREEYEKLLAAHHCEMLLEQEAQVARHAVACLDLSVLQNAINAASRADSVESTFQMHGAGGTLEGTVCRKNLPALKAQMYGRMSVAVLGTLGLVVGLIALFGLEDLRGLAVCGFWGMLAAVPLMWSWAMEKRQEVRDYERGQTGRSAKG